MLMSTAALSACNVKNAAMNPPMGNLLMLAAFCSQKLSELSVLLSAAATRR